jgi:twitching motility protein PilT
MNDGRSTAVPASVSALVVKARALQASDVHLDPEQGVALRIASRIQRLPTALVGQADIERFVELAFDRLSRARLDKLGIADALYADGEVGALRVHASRGGRGHRLAIRLLARSVPELASLRLPPIVASFGDYRYGFVLVCGPGGSGKTTTVASLLQRANESSARHVVTLEAPIEHVLPWGTSVVTQYEVGRDVASYAHGVRGALRADPDLIFIGELSDADAAAACLQAAESGHLVIGALDAPPEVPLALNRLVGLFPVEEQQRARNRLAENLRAVLALRLVPARDGSGMRPAAEILLTNDAVRRMLRDGATHLIRGQISANRKSGMQTLEAHLADLVGAGEVDLDVARSLALYPEDVREPQFAARERS